ncbi:AMP-binding protein [Streptomyces sp. NPDC058674]|uniref:AMP-binding protein n=1 Tax=Streptomyces sp. NPDC058674 TaxID=3346592 RepID=UPI003651DA3D
MTELPGVLAHDDTAKAPLYELGPFQQAALGTADRELALHVRVPGATVAGLRDSLYRAAAGNPVLTARHEWPQDTSTPLQRSHRITRRQTAEGHGWELSGGTLRIRISGGWDGPEVKITCSTGFADAASLGLLMADAEALLAGGPAQAIARADYLAVAQRHRSMVRRGELAQEEQYWAARRPAENAGRPGVTDLVPGGTDESATDRASERCVLDRQTYQAMEKLAADAGCSVSDVACFALAVVVHRLGIDPDEFGMAADARELLGLGEVAGPFGQVFRLGGVIDPHSSGAAALHRWAQRLTEARSMLGVPALAQGSGRPHLVFDATEEPALPDGWYQASWFHPAGDTLTCSLRLAPGGGALQIDSTAAAPRMRLTALLHAWSGLLADLAARPDVDLSRLALVPAAMQEQMAEGMARRLRRRAAQPLAERFRQHVRETPDATAFRRGAEQASYRELGARVAAVAEAVGPLGQGAVVAVLAEAEPDLLAALLAVDALGGAFLPLSPHEPVARLAEAMRHAEAGVLLTGSGAPDIEVPQGCRVLALADVTAEAAADGRPGPAGPRIDSQAPTAGPTDPAYLLRTSGSTGVPKLVEISRSSLANYLRWSAEEFLPQRTVLPVLSSPVFDASLKQTLGVLYGGGCVTFLAADRLDLDAVRDELRTYDGQVALNCVPSYASALLSAFESGAPRVLPEIAHFLLGGEPLDASLVQRITALFPGAQIWNLYGPTETTATATAGRVHPGRTVHVGTAIAGAAIAVVDEQGLPLPYGVRGEVVIGGPGVARGYRTGAAGTSPFSHLDLARQVFPVYRTGDIGVLDEDGTLRVSGRRDNQIKVNGWRIDLGEVERVALGAEGVREAAVVLDARDEPCLRAFVTGTASADLVLAAFQRHLPRPMIPKSVTVLPAFDILVNGKTDRKALLRRAERHEEAVPEEYTAEERIVAGAWRELLDQGWPRPDDDFFSVGGHSLLLARLVNQLRSQGHVELSLQQVVRQPTVTSIARLIDASRRG